MSSNNVRHPLRSPTGNDDAGITRPHLSRLTQDTPSESSSDNDDRRSPSHDQEVIVHKVTSQDSLPGVSLKYGIPLAELRQFNQLWTSDSIHLRNVLYIPVERATRAHHSSLRAEDAENRSPHTPSIPSSAIIQRVPISQLSFFPSCRIQPRITRRRSFTEHSIPSSSTSLPRSFARTQSFQPTPSTPPFTATASYRDDLIARLSLDSIRPRPGAKRKRRFDTGENHELESVTTASNPVPKFRFSFEDRLNGGGGHELRTPSVNVPYRDNTEHIRRVPSSSPPSFYIPPSSSLSVVRTVQMEPSPIMQIPKRKSNFLHSNHSRNGITRDRDVSTEKLGLVDVPHSSAQDAMELQDTSTPLSG
ncbi:hypothetical protein APHAL10511_003634 [Amanita phalloides]|nr:hypothetical protein APHAL10511_003634 [Amanita phalloides]